MLVQFVYVLVQNLCANNCTKLVQIIARTCTTLVQKLYAVCTLKSCMIFVQFCTIRVQFWYNFVLVQKKYDSIPRMHVATWWQWRAAVHVPLRSIFKLFQFDNFHKKCPIIMIFSGIIKLT